ncbi:potassium-transporting ATPase B chain domain protein, partial [Mycobacterium avium MAV_120709_2344]
MANTTTERPSGVSSARLDSCAASANSSGDTPANGMKAAACRLPSVMVPVLSSSRVLTSPAASTARPDMAST